MDVSKLCTGNSCNSLQNSRSVSDSISPQLFTLTILQFFRFAAFLLSSIKACQILMPFNAGKVCLRFLVCKMPGIILVYLFSDSGTDHSVLRTSSEKYRKRALFHCSHVLVLRSYHIYFSCVCDVSHSITVCINICIVFNHYHPALLKGIRMLIILNTSAVRR